MMTTSIFDKLYEINVNEHVEKKGKFSYLSWAWAVAALRKASPSATWEVVKSNDMPYCKTETGYFVEVAVTVEGVTLSQIHPVLDNNNKTIPAPSAFQINTSIQRCLVKAIALHGLGLYIYAGEDLPEDEEVKPAIKQSPAPNLIPPPLTDEEIELCIAAMNGCTELEALRGIANGAHKRANAAQKTMITYIFNVKKALIEKAS